MSDSSDDDAPIWVHIEQMGHSAASRTAEVDSDASDSIPISALAAGSAGGGDVRPRKKNRDGRAKNGSTRSRAVEPSARQMSSDKAGKSSKKTNGSMAALKRAGSMPIARKAKSSTPAFDADSSDDDGKPHVETAGCEEIARKSSAESEKQSGDPARDHEVANTSIKLPAKKRQLLSDGDDDDVDANDARHATDLTSNGSVKSAAKKQPIGSDNDEDATSHGSNEHPTAEVVAGETLKIGAKTHPMPCKEDEANSDDGSEDETIGQLAAVEIATQKKEAKRGDVEAGGSDGISACSESDDCESDVASDMSEYVPHHKRSKPRSLHAGGKRDDNDSDGSDVSSYSLLSQRKRNSKKLKLQKRSALSESDDDEPIDWRQAAAIQHKFSNAPRKHVEPARLASTSFLVVGRIGSRTTWKLPYRDHSGKINLQLLEAARQVVLTGMTRARKKVDYVISPEVQTTVKKLWADAKLWHRAYGNQAPTTHKATSPQLSEGQKKPKNQAKMGQSQEMNHDSDDEMETLDSLLKSHDGAAVEVSEGEGSVIGYASETEGADEAQAQAADDDEEMAYLKEVQADQQQRQVKERFWRRDAEFIVEDGEESEHEGSGYGSDEALEAGQHSRVPLEVDLRLDQQQMYDMLHSESQKLLRKQHSVLPCRKEKQVELGSLLKKIQQRQVSKRSGCVVVEEEEVALPEVVCSECQVVLSEDCVPFVDSCKRIYCSQLCFAMVRSRDEELPPKTAPESRETVKSTDTAEDDDDDENLLVVLAPPTAEEKKLKLAREISRVGRDSGQVLLEREKLRRKLHGTATDQKRETARTTGRYECIEQEESLAVALDSCDDSEEEAVDGETEGIKLMSAPLQVPASETFASDAKALPMGEDSISESACADLSSTQDTISAVADSSVTGDVMHTKSRGVAGVTFGRRKIATDSKQLPLHNKSPFANEEETKNALPRPVEDELAELEQAHLSAEQEEISAPACGGLVDAEAADSGKNASESEEGADTAEEDTFMVNDGEEEDSAEEEPPDDESHDCKETAKAAKKAERKAARRAKRDALAARKAEKKAARAQFEGYEEDDLESLDSFIADSDEEEDKIPEVEVVEEDEEEDIIAQTIRAKLGSDWVVGDKSCPALSDGEGDEEDRACALRQKLKSTLKRSRCKETDSDAPQTGTSVSTLFPTLDEKSLSVWSLMGDNSSSALPRVKRQASGPATTRGNSVSSSANGNPVAPLARIGSFNVPRRGNSDNSNLLSRLANGSRGETSFSKTYVFGQKGGESSSHGMDTSMSGVEIENLGGTSTSTFGAPLPKARLPVNDGFAKSPSTVVGGKPKASFLATVLSKSKHFAKPMVAKAN
ncbi:MAG: hypothetical protein SGPRY_001005 [Prymnesium sp.]